MFRGAGIGKANAGDGDVKLGLRPEHLVRENKGGLELYLQIAKAFGGEYIALWLGARQVISRLP